MPINEDAIDFLKYAFTETKDLAEHFIAVVTGVLVFSLTFSEKVANFSTATRTIRLTIAAAWSSMLLAIIACGIAICYVALSGGAASSNRSPEEYWGEMYVAIRWLSVAGGLFVLGLTALLVSALISAWDPRKPHPTELKP
jgi:H+/Cl- antiporter ClcA